MAQSRAEEDYLKTIYLLDLAGAESASTSSISIALGVKPCTVTDMLKKMRIKNLISYIPYRGAVLTQKGEIVALKIIRKQRLWKTFLVET